MAQRTDPATLVDTDAMRRFHRLVYGRLPWPEGAVVGVATMTSGRMVRTDRRPVGDVDGFVDLAVKAVGAGLDCYVNVAPQRPGLDISARGAKKDSYGLPALFADVDTSDGVHKAVGKPGAAPCPTVAEALELLKGFPLPISLLVHTGGGFHVWCCVEDEPLDHESAEGIEVLKRWKAAVKRTFDDAGRNVDVGVLGDPARMLRVPGTVNFKAEPRPVRLLADASSTPELWADEIDRWVAAYLPSAA